MIVNSKLVDSLVRHYEGSSSVPAESRLNDLTANLRFIVKYGHFLPDEIMTSGVANIRGNHVVAQERKLQTKVFLDQQDVTGTLLNPDYLFESAFQEILFIVTQAKEQGLQYLPYVPLSIVVDKEQSSQRPCLTFVTRFAVTPATHIVIEPMKPYFDTHTVTEAASAPVVTQTVTETVTQTVVGGQVTPPPDLHPSLPVTAVQAAIATSPEELDETPFISDVVAPNPSRDEAAALYNPAAPLPVRTVVQETVAPVVIKRRSGNTATGPARKGGWPKGKPRKPKVDVLDTNGQV